MTTGKQLRMGRLFNRQSGRMVLVTVDHGICVEPMREINDPVAVVRQVAAGGADAVLLTPGIARRAASELAGSGTSLMLRIDGTATSIGPDLTNDQLVCSVEGALRLGADAVATFGIIGVPREAEMSRKIGYVAEECEKWGIPQLAEMLPAENLAHQFEPRADRKWFTDVSALQFNARVAIELGADIIKGYYTGDKESFRAVLDYCPAPYVVLAGPAAGDPEIFLRFVADSVAAGAAGVSVGRNVWTYPDPTAITRALCRIVHEDATPAQAMKS